RAAAALIPSTTLFRSRLAPETSRDRAERAARERHVTMTPLADGMARVTAVLRGIDAVGMMKTLDAGARSLRAAGEKTSASALERSEEHTSELQSRFDL